MHTRKEILENQEKYKEEITKFLKQEFRELRRDIEKIKSDDPAIVAGKNSLLAKSKKVKVNEEISKLFISWKNIYPAYYAWWDEKAEQVLKLRYTDKK